MEADQVTNLEREKTKRVVYAVVYGVGKYCVCVVSIGLLSL